ncbi:MAG: hypothetical protein ABJB66_16440, partial [Gemmatimonadaceae bacterium]
HTGSFGFGVLSETQMALSGSHSDGNRYLNLPNALVRIASDFGTETNAVQQVVIGGNPSLDRTQTTALLAGNNQLSWFSANNKHRLKLSSELSAETLNEQLATNTLGSFRFNSLADLEDGRASSFIRQLASPKHDVVNYRAGLALGDAYAPIPALQLQYGVRVDVNRFNAPPVANPLVQSTFGFANDAVPNRIDFSPRLGFSWSYGSAHQVGALSGSSRAPRATVRGGVGLFQGVPSSSSIVSSLDNTGLPSAARQLTCTGPASPIANWSLYRDNANIPTTCADGAGALPFVNDRPNVTLYDRNFSPPKSIRSNVQWAGQVLDGRFNLQMDFTESYNLSQAGTVDLNFLPTTQFALAQEGNRPVFVPMDNVDPLTGATGNASRRSTQFASVTQLRSDLQSEARQFTIGISPTGVHTTFQWSLAYVHANIRDQVRGFTSTAGNPLDREWGRSSLDARHQVVYSLGYNLLDLFRVSWSGSLRSGNPFTPYVGNDINGDGRANDRAFVFDLANVNDVALRDGISALLNSGPRAVRQCLQRQMNHVAQRNSCEGPWTSSASLNISFNPVRWWRSNRLDVAFQVSNPLGAADLLLHGANELRGWGQPAAVNDNLYFVKGFTTATNSFVYDVNSRFGDSSPAHNSIRAPVMLTAIVRFDFGPTRERQSLSSQLDRGRREGGTKMSEGALKSLLNSGGVFNPLAAILRNGDTLKLTSPQSDSLTVLSALYNRRIEQTWAPIVKKLAALPASYNRGDAYDLYVSGRHQTIDMLSSLAPSVLSLLTASQRRALPVEVLSHLNHNYLATIRSGTAGLGLAFLPGVSAPTAGPGGGSGSVVSFGR